jgi:Entner-Doudoroff aldolase
MQKLLLYYAQKNYELAIKRGLELVELGCKALEITLDSENALQILKELCNKIPLDKCIVGVGTVLDSKQVEEVAKIGAKFAISPITPKNFIKTCHSCGLLAIPAAFTPNEIWSAYLEGAKIVKLFPAQLWTPESLRDLKNIGDFRKLSFMPSGSVNPQNVDNWLKNGADCVGMGSNLVGKDIRYSNHNINEIQIANKEWIELGQINNYLKIFTFLLF